MHIAKYEAFTLESSFEIEGAQETPSISDDSRTLTREVEGSFLLFLRFTAPAVVVRQNFESFRMPSKRTISNLDNAMNVYGHLV